MSLKNYFWSLVLILCTFFLTNVVFWMECSGRVFNGNDGHGDLLRLGNLPYAASITKQVHPEKHHTEFKDYLTSNADESFDILTIGDSFSNGGGGSYYQDELIRQTGLSILNVPLQKHHPYEILAALENLGYLDRIHPKVIILETVERGINGTWGIEKLPSKTLTNDDFSSAAKSKKRHLSLMVKTNVLFLKNKILFHQHPYRLTDTTDMVPLDDAAFTASNREQKLIFYHDDLSYQQAPADCEKINTNLNRVAEELHQRGIQLIFLPGPDKFDVYYPQLPEVWKEQWPENPFFYRMNALPKDYIFIDSRKPLRELVAHGEKDIYWSDDTHWSWKSHSVICTEIIRQIKTAPPSR